MPSRKELIELLAAITSDLRTALEQAEPQLRIDVDDMCKTLDRYRAFLIEVAPPTARVRNS